MAYASSLSSTHVWQELYRAAKETEKALSLDSQVSFLSNLFWILVSRELCSLSWMISHLPDWISEIRFALAQRDQYLPVEYGFNVHAASLIQKSFFA